LAAVGAGVFRDIREACAATIEVVRETPVNAAAKRYHKRAFPEYQQLYQSLRGDFKRITALG
jgi:xylulokinase